MNTRTSWTSVCVQRGKACYVVKAKPWESSHSDKPEGCKTERRGVGNSVLDYVQSNAKVVVEWS
jgi:hypothetical protein